MKVYIDAGQNHGKIPVSGPPYVGKSHPNGKKRMRVFTQTRMATTSHIENASIFQSLGMGLSSGLRFARMLFGGTSERSIVAVLPPSECSRNWP